jgi:UDP-N-acetyl-D-mannosaminuronate dehydrogenase
LKTIIIGVGEIGSALQSILSKAYPHQVWALDIIQEKTYLEGCPPTIDVMHICLRHSQDFNKQVKEYVEKYKPQIVNICTTAPVGTTESFGKRNFVHSTTRGLHPNLITGLVAIPKHVGGDLQYARILSAYFNKAGVECVLHNCSATTELLHILNNVHYGINLIFADEAAKLCREYGVDYLDYLAYTQTNNRGYVALGHDSKVRPILTPPNGRIGGHCVVMSANLIPQDKRNVLVNHLAHYGNSNN